MTTIAIKDGVVAYDTRMTSNGLIHPGCWDKAVVSVKHQAIFAGCGTVTEIAAAFRYLEEAPAMPWTEEGQDIDWAELLDDSSVFAVSRDGRGFYFEAGGWFECASAFHSIGSGCVSAIAAMHAGADAIQAVEIACKVDAYSGLPVRFFTLDMIPPLPVMELPRAPGPMQTQFFEPKAKKTSAQKPKKKPGRRMAA